MVLNIPFTHIVFYSDEPADTLAPELPDALEYLEPGDLIRLHTTVKRNVETLPGCYVVKFYPAVYAGRVVSVDQDTVTVRYYIPELLMWRRADAKVENIELILKHNVEI